MKICAITSHSENNQFLYNLTVKNHIDYFNKYGISYLTYIEDYDKFLNVQLVKSLLNYYDLIFSIGSDVIFTDFKTNIFSFIDLDKNINVCLEGLGISLINAQIVFYRNGCQAFLKEIDKLQKQNENAEFGLQSILNDLYNINIDFAYKNINLIQAGKLQKYLFNDQDMDFRRQYAKENLEKLLWKNGDFMLHTIGGSNQNKFFIIKTVLDMFKFN